ncbi:sigma-70 family RNA polymerase sigma factor [Pedococcus sp. NPDC057267]|uniref:sigma-70 family RNA polymerase sigma factor n=1 Tax=Pedococcus sp. NPDC057267 TaxID=3346077 RepID=UPI00363876D1
MDTAPVSARLSPVPSEPQAPAPRPLEPSDSARREPPERPHHHSAAHQEAEQLLLSLAGQLSSEDRRELERQVVLLTLDLADRAARRYRGRGLEFEDLRQVASLALLKAVRGFRPGRGPGFAAYAVPTISGELKRFFRDTGWAVRPPRRLQETRARVLRSEEELRQDLQREPTRDEVANAVGLDLAGLEESAEAASWFSTSSLDAPGGDHAVEVPDVSDAYADLDRSDALGRALDTLDARELAIVRMRYVEERTQSDIGAAIGVSQMQVSRLLAATLEHLRVTMVEADAVA